MRESGIAEALIALITHRDRAISITGDLLEERQGRGAVWFWWHVVRTMLSFFLQEVSSTPIRTVTLVVCGRLLLIAGSAIITRPLMDLYVANWEPGLNYIWKQWLVVVLWGRLVCPFLVGLALAKVSGGKEVVICIALATLTEAHFVLLSFWMARPLEFLLLNSVPLLPLLVAGVLSRRRALSRLRTA